MRGTQKKILYVKSTGGAVFDEAFFVLKDGREDDGGFSGDILGEANRIIEEHTARGGQKKECGERGISPALFFLSGMLLSAALFFAFYFFFLK